MYEEHITDEDIKKFVTYNGTLKGEEGKAFIELSKNINGHIRGCQECLDKVRDAQREQDKMDGIEDDYIPDRSKHILTPDKIAERLGMSKEEFEEISKFAEISNKMHDKGHTYSSHEGVLEQVKKESIEMKIAKTAAKNWGQQEPQNLEEAKGITWGSEISSIRGIISVLGLNPELEQQITEDVYIRDTISEDIAKQIQSKIQRNGNSNIEIIEMLSVVHDEWVKTNPNKFMQQDRNKEYQFVPFQMLSWKEAKSDLLFLKPILEAAGVKVDEQAIEQQFEIVQKEFLIDNGIDSLDKLKFKLKQGSDFYPALEGIETKNGGNIDGLLKNDEILEKMAGQVESQIDIKSREEMAIDLIKSDNKGLDELFWVQTVARDVKNDEKLPYISEPASKREILLSKLIGKPYPTYFQGITLPNHDRYENRLEGWGGHEYAMDLTESTRILSASKARESDSSELDKEGVITFGYDKNAEVIQGNIKVCKRDLIAHQLEPDRMGWSERTIDKKGKVSPKDIAKADEGKGIRTEEIGGVKGFITKALDKFKGIGEK